MLPFEKNTIRIYMFYFEGYENPLIIEAENKKEAINYLADELEKLHPGLLNVEVIDIKISTPIYGATEKEENGIIYVWAGFDYAPSGWLTKDQFDKLKVF